MLSNVIVVWQGGDYDSDREVNGRRDGSHDRMSVDQSDDDDVEGENDNNRRQNDSNDRRRDSNESNDDLDEYDSEEDEDYDDRPKKKKKRSAVSKFIFEEAGL